MPRYAIVSDGIVINVVRSDVQPSGSILLGDREPCGPGWSHHPVDGFTAPEPRNHRTYPVRYLWRALTAAEQTAISAATPGTALHLFWQEIQLVNASGDPIWLDHPRFIAAIDALEASGDLSAETCTKIRNGELE